MWNAASGWSPPDNIRHGVCTTYRPDRQRDPLTVWGSVGLYFARHGALLTWPLPHLTTALLGQVGADTAGAARADFCAAATRAWAADGGQPTTPSLGK
jgi:hypothetical protein